MGRVGESSASLEMEIFVSDRSGLLTRETVLSYLVHGKTKSKWAYSEGHEIVIEYPNTRIFGYKQNLYVAETLVVYLLHSW